MKEIATITQVNQKPVEKNRGNVQRRKRRNRSSSSSRGSSYSRSSSSSESDSDPDASDDEEDKNNTAYDRFKERLKTNVENFWKNKIFRACVFLIILVAYFVYFGFAIHLNKPFDIPSGLNSTELFSNYIFSNNRGINFSFVTKKIKENKNNKKNV
jgi:hypothetical protein